MHSRTEVREDMYMARVSIARDRVTAGRQFHARRAAGRVGAAKLSPEENRGVEARIVRHVMICISAHDNSPPTPVMIFRTLYIRNISLPLTVLSLCERALRTSSFYCTQTHGASALSLSLLCFSPRCSL